MTYNDEFDDMLGSIALRDNGTTFDVLDHPLNVSVFMDQQAFTIKRRVMTIRELSEEIHTPTAIDKGRLPWLKMAVFGDSRTEAGALRHTGNLEMISGIEGDYDAGEIALQDAAQRLQDAGIAALLFTTPSHIETAPRYRIICPLSEDLVADEREKLCARLNGALGGILAKESFTRSQAYHFGSVEGSKAPLVTLLVEGRALDHADELDEGALGKDGKPYGEIVTAERTTPAEPFDRARAKSALAAIPIAHGDNMSTGGRDLWRNVGMALHNASAGSDEAFNLWAEWSRGGTKFKSDKALKEEWVSFGRGKPRRPIGIGSLYHIASSEYGWSGSLLDVDAAIAELDDLPPLPAILTDLLRSGTDAFEDLLGAPFKGEEAAPKVPGWVAKLNRKHALALIEGKVVILTEKPGGGVSYGTVPDMKYLYDNCRVPIEGKPKSTETIFGAWMRHKGRREYINGIVFAPGRTVDGAYNHWRGFKVQPDASASCDLFLSHLRELICSGDLDAYHWLIGWLAHMIQMPGEKPGTAVVLKGRKGTGKDTVGDYVGGLFPAHHTKISNPEHLVGRFNAHQDRTLLLHLEEGFWAGNKGAESSLKSLITNPRVMIEPKGLNAFQVDSCLRIFISSNESWVVPATFDERRFFVLNVAAKREPAYYAALYREMANGGRAALLHYLQSIDLSEFDVRNPPMTSGLRDQTLESLRNVDRWWYETLASGELRGVAGGDLDSDSNSEWSEGVVDVQCQRLWSNYRDWLRDHRFDGAACPQTVFGRKIKDLAPGVETVRPRVNGHVGPRAYQLPALEVCRAQFEAVVGMSVDWSDGGD